MDPQLKSILGSVGLGAAMALTGWMVKQGYISAADQSADANYLLAAAGVVVAGLIGWYKTHQVSQPVMMKAVNAAPNGATVVSTEAAKAAGIPPISEPLKLVPGK